MMMNGESVDDQVLTPPHRGFKGRIQENPRVDILLKVVINLQVFHRWK